MARESKIFDAITGEEDLLKKVVKRAVKKGLHVGFDIEALNNAEGTDCDIYTPRSALNYLDPAINEGTEVVGTHMTNDSRILKSFMIDAHDAENFTYYGDGYQQQISNEVFNSSTMGGNDGLASFLENKNVKICEIPSDRVLGADSPILSKAFGSVSEFSYVDDITTQPTDILRNATDYTPESEEDGLGSIYYILFATLCVGALVACVFIYKRCTKAKVRYDDVNTQPKNKKDRLRRARATQPIRETQPSKALFQARSKRPLCRQRIPMELFENGEQGQKNTTHSEKSKKSNRRARRRETGRQQEVDQQENEWKRPPIRRSRGVVDTTHEDVAQVDTAQVGTTQVNTIQVSPIQEDSFPLRRPLKLQERREKCKTQIQKVDRVYSDELDENGQRIEISAIQVVVSPSAFGKGRRDTHEAVASQRDQEYESSELGGYFAGGRG